MKRIRQILWLGAELFKHPGQVRYLPRLLASRGKSTMELRLPWLPFSAVDYLEERIGRNSRVFEFGGGGSTAWFSDRVDSVATVESDHGWAEIIERETRNNARADVHLRSSDDSYREYVSIVDTFPDESFDLVLVDGRERIQCLKRSVRVLSPGGLLVLDDSNRESYREAGSVLSGWSQKIFTGFAPCKDEIGVTTIWTKPHS